MTRNGGEPLSEERIEATARNFRLRCPGHGRWSAPYCEECTRQILRAFAREITEPLEKDIEQACQSYQDLGRVWAESSDAVDAALGIPDGEHRPRMVKHTLAAVEALKSRLLASQEREKRLAEALENISGGMHSGGYLALVKIARDALAYRDSGGGTLGQGENPA